MSTGQIGWQGHPPRVVIGQANPEAAKYSKIWETPEYRIYAPGEEFAQEFLDQARPKPGSEVVDFGCGTGRGGLLLTILGKLRVILVDFVKNCLDPEIQQALTTQAEVLRFVKADLEQPLPVAAEYGYCTDVMEHIPPERVDQTLDSILLAAEHVFFSISTVVDDYHTLVDAPLHLSVHPHQWWMDHFLKRECLVHWSDEREKVSLFYVTAWQPAASLADAGTINTPTEQILANIRQNTQGGWVQLRSHQINEAEVVILGGGPSLAGQLDDIRAKRAAGAKLVTLNGTYNWAREHDLWPVTQIMVDARAFNARFVQPIDRRNIYLISSACHPSVFEGLPEDRTWIWHTSAPEIQETLSQAYSRWNIIPGGSTVLLRAIPLLRTLGFTKFHLYGCDSCLTAGTHHAYAQPENDGSWVVNCRVTGGRVFQAYPWMISQAHEMIDLIKMIGNDVELEIYGDGLLAHMLRTAAEIEEMDSTAP